MTGQAKPCTTTYHAFNSLLSHSYYSNVAFHLCKCYKRDKFAQVSMKKKRCRAGNFATLQKASQWNEHTKRSLKGTYFIWKNPSHLYGYFFHYILVWPFALCTVASYSCTSVLLLLCFYLMYRELWPRYGSHYWVRDDWVGVSFGLVVLSFCY